MLFAFEYICQSKSPTTAVHVAIENELNMLGDNIPLWNLRLSQRCCCRVKSSGMWHCVTSQETWIFSITLNTIKLHSAYWQITYPFTYISSLGWYAYISTEILCFKIMVTTYRPKPCHIAQNFDLHQHRFENPKSCIFLFTTMPKRLRSSVLFTVMNTNSWKKKTKLSTLYTASNPEGWGIEYLIHCI